MTLFLRVQPGGRQYRLPDEEDGAEIIQALADVIGSEGCVVLGYELPDHPRANATVILSGLSVESVELVDVPADADE